MDGVKFQVPFRFSKFAFMPESPLWLMVLHTSIAYQGQGHRLALQILGNQPPSTPFYVSQYILVGSFLLWLSGFNMPDSERLILPSAHLVCAQSGSWPSASFCRALCAPRVGTAGQEMAESPVSRFFPLRQAPDIFPSPLCVCCPPFSPHGCPPWEIAFCGFS